MIQPPLQIGFIGNIYRLAAEQIKQKQLKYINTTNRWFPQIQLKLKLIMTYAVSLPSYRTGFILSVTHGQVPEYILLPTKPVRVGDLADTWLELLVEELFPICIISLLLSLALHGGISMFYMQHQGL